MGSAIPKPRFYRARKLVPLCAVLRCVRDENFEAADSRESRSRCYRRCNITVFSTKSDAIGFKRIHAFIQSLTCKSTLIRCLKGSSLQYPFFYPLSCLLRTNTILLEQRDAPTSFSLAGGNSTCWNSNIRRFFFVCRRALLECTNALEMALARLVVLLHG